MSGSGRHKSVPILLLALACGDASAATDPVAEQIRAGVAQWRAGQAVAPAGAMPFTPGAAAFYEARNYAPAWTGPRNLRELAEALRGIREDGLEPRDYSLALIEQRLADPRGAPAALAELDLQLTHCYLHALLHLRRGKLDPKRLNVRWNLEPGREDHQQLLQAALEAVKTGRIREAFAQARPSHPGYATLRNELARLRRIQAQGGWGLVPGKPALAPGVAHSNVAVLRRRLSLGGYLPAAATSGEHYDAGLEQAVRRFQSEHYLEETGAVGPKTLAALNLPVAARIDQLRINLERARWILPEIHGELILVDVAGFRLHHLKNAKSVWQSRVQVGQAVRPTPIFKSAITHVTFNPAWTVPPGILRKDVAPKARRNPGYLRQNRIHIYDARGRELDADDVDWDEPRGVTLRQEPFPGGALGRVAIRFPSPYMVYLHETPHTRLFSAEQRAFSSGCIRVEKAYELAGLLLGLDRAELDRHVAAGKTHDVKLPQPMTILLLYWTVDLREGGRVSYKPDLYRQDPRTRAALDQPPADTGF